MKHQYCSLSFGAGVQSTALLLLVRYEPQRLVDAVGVLPNKAYFADTQAEPDYVYDHLRSCLQWSPIPLEVVTKGSLIDDLNRDRVSIPVFTLNEEGKRGLTTRTCTRDYKVRPLVQAVIKDANLKRGAKKSIALWLGISCDEAHRMKDNPDPRFENIYPLVELGWNRNDCYQYCLSHQVDPPKSACYVCPFRKDWAALRRRSPADFDKAVQYDRSLRDRIENLRLKSPAFLHSSCQPLEQAVPNQGHLWEGYYSDGFGNDCEGMCGV